MKVLANIAGTLFGIVFIFLSFAVALETTLRKVFNFSLQGVDELGGYVLAIGAALAFSVALVERAHIRIDLVHERLPRSLRIPLNVLSVAATALVAGMLLAMAWYSLRDSIALNSTAQTPWATPLKYPQMLWFAALGIFAALALAYFARVLWLAAKVQAEQLDRDYSPKGTKEELKEELDDIKARGLDAGAGR